MSTPTPSKRYHLSVDFTPPDGQTPAEAHEWLQKWFDFFHPSMEAKVVGKTEIFAAEEPPPTELL